MKLKALIIMILMVSVILSSGCNLNENNSRYVIIYPLPRGVVIEPSMSEIQQKIMQEDPDYYHADMVIKMNMMFNYDGTTQEMISKINMGSDVDRKNRKMKIKTTVSSNIPEMQEGFLIETYIINEDIYTNFEGDWTKAKMLQNIWEANSISSQDAMMQIEDIMASGSIEYLKTDAINGKTYYVVKVIPDLNTVNQLMQEIMGQQARGIVSVDVTSYSIIMWVNKDTFRVEGMEAEFGMRVGATDKNTGKRITFKASAQLNAQITNINKKVTISLPTASRNAVDLGYA